MANVTEPLWEPGLKTGRSGSIQAGTVLSGEHRRTPETDRQLLNQRGGVTDGQKLKETSKTRDPGHRQLRISSRLAPAVRCIEHCRDCTCQDRTIRQMSRGSPMDRNHYRKPWETGRSGAILACSHTHHTAGKSGDG